MLAASQMPGLSVHICMAVAFMSLAVIILVLRDIRCRINANVAMILVAFAVLAVLAVAAFINLLPTSLGTQ